MFTSRGKNGRAELCNCRCRAAIGGIRRRLSILAAAAILIASPAAAQPSNDDCANPITVFTNTPFNGNTAGATGVNDSSCGGSGDTADVWHTWIADCTGTITVSLCGSTFDTTLSVFDPFCPVAPANQLACNDDATGICSPQSQVQFQAIIGFAYAIRVAGFGGATGDYTLLVTCPPLGACCIGSGACLDLTATECADFSGAYLGDNTTCAVEGAACAFGACCDPVNGCTVIPSNDAFDCQFNAGGIYLGDGTDCTPDECPAFGACCTGGGQCANLSQADCEAGGSVYLGDGTSCAVVGAACTTGACCGSTGCVDTGDENACLSGGGSYRGDGTTCDGSFVCNDDCTTAQNITVPFSTVIDNSIAQDGAPGSGIGSCDGTVGVVKRDVWYRWTATEDCEATVTWAPLVGQDNVLIVWQSLSPNPDDDCFGGAFSSVPPVPGPNEVDCQECGDGAGACPDPGNPEVSTFFASAGTTYWFQCGQEGFNQPSVVGPSSFTLECSNVVGGCCVGGVCQVAFESECDDLGGLYLGDDTTCAGGCPASACCGSDGLCTLAATQAICEAGGGTWQGDGSTCDDVVCGGACCVPGGCEEVNNESICTILGGTYQGNGSTCADSLCHDECVNAIPVQTGVAYNGASVGATGVNDSSCAGTLDTASVWHTWQADCTGNVAFSLCGSGYDTSLAIFDACPPSTELACNDDNFGVCGPGNHSHIQLDVFEGNTYYIRIAGWNGATGSYSLLVSCPPVGACCAAGQCTDGTEAACDQIGGVYLGDGTECATSGNACMVGACCLPSGSCNTDGNQAACDAAGGLYLGDATMCTPDACPAVGACCVETSPGNFACSVDFQAECDNAGGTYLGDDTDCTPAPGTTDRCDCNDNGVVDSNDLLPNSGQPGTPMSYPSIDTPVAVPDVGGGDATSTINVADAGVVTRITLSMQVTHSFVGDLEIELTHDGVTRRFWDNNCVSDDGFDIVFDDASALFIDCNGTFPVGTFRPVNSFAPFLNMPAAGEWTVTARDLVGGDTGSIDSWTLHLEIGAPAVSTDCDGDAILDECEQIDPGTVGACCADGACTNTTEEDCLLNDGMFLGLCTDCSLEGAGCPGEQFVLLNYNWNGLVHTGESNQPDSVDGYRSIGDRGLTIGTANSIGGTAGNLTLGNLTYWLERRSAPALDTVHVGFRRDVFDLVVDGDDIGISPTWDPSLLGDGKNVPASTTAIPPTAPLDASFEFGILYDASEGGGDFDMTLGFTDNSSVTVRFDAPDWFANNNPIAQPPGPGVAEQSRLTGPLSGGDGFDGAGNVDRGLAAQPLNVIHGRVTAASLLAGPQNFDVVGRQLNSVTFNNWAPNSIGNNAAGVGIYAASMVTPAPGDCTCPGDLSGDQQLAGDDVQGFVDCLLGAGGDCSCADVDGAGGATLDDVDDFVQKLLDGPGC